MTDTTTNKNAIKPEQIESNSHLARLVGRSEKAIRLWQQDARWTFGPSPWPASMLPTFEAWRDALAAGECVPIAEAQADADPADDPALPARMVDLKLKLARLAQIEASTERTRLSNAAKRGYLVSREVVQQAHDEMRVQVASALRAATHTIVAAAPPDAHQPIRQAIGAEVEKVLAIVRRSILPPVEHEEEAHAGK